MSWGLSICTTSHSASNSSLKPHPATDIVRRQVNLLSQTAFPKVLFGWFRPKSSPSSMIAKPEEQANACVDVQPIFYFIFSWWWCVINRGIKWTSVIMNLLTYSKPRFSCLGGWSQGWPCPSHFLSLHFIYKNIGRIVIVLAIIPICTNSLPLTTSVAEICEHSNFKWILLKRNLTGQETWAVRE